MEFLPVIHQMKKLLQFQANDKEVHHISVSFYIVYSWVFSEDLGQRLCQGCSIGGSNCRGNSNN